LHIPKEPSEMGDKSFTHSLVAPIWDCLGKAALAPEDLDVLVLHGGSCRNPYVRRELKRLLSDDLSLFSRISACSCSAGK
jgi:molecular chaperone DnaK (HSP70)